MFALSHFRPVRHIGVSFVLVFASGLMGSAGAADTAHERMRLAAVLRQLDAVERVLAPEARRFQGEPGSRVLDYPALIAELEQARARIGGHLAPPRALPAEPVDLQRERNPSGDTSDQEPSP